MVLVLATASPALAGPVITIDDTATNDTVTISATGFLTFTGAGAGLQEGGFTGNLTGSWASSAVASSHAAITYMVEANNQSVVSDYLKIAIASDGKGTAFITATFISDSEIGPGLGPVQPGTNLNVVTETGPFTLSFPDFDNLSITINSDLEVPEPATLTLLAVGLAGMVGSGWRRRGKQIPRLNAVRTVVILWPAL
jgi:hypothetical protein